MLSALFSAIARRRAQARAIETLGYLDDHRLRDLGISRDQIEMFVTGQIKTGSV